MKRTLTLFLAVLSFLAVSCEPLPNTREVAIQLSLDGANYEKSGVEVTVSANGVQFNQQTDETGVALFTLPLGVFEVNASFREMDGEKVFNFNGAARITVQAVKGADAEAPALEVRLPLVKSTPVALIIKELYTGGCMDNEGVSGYQNDKYMVVYNNSSEPVDASKLGVAMVAPMSPTLENKYYNDGVYSYEAEGWVPVIFSMWWFADGKQVVIEPYSQISIAITGAVDHTVTYSNSVDLSTVDFCMYDPESGFNKEGVYPAPADGIDASCYMKTKVFGQGSAWPIFYSQPGLIIFRQGEKSALQMSEDTEAMDHTFGSGANYNTVKLPMSQILDVTDVWAAENNPEKCNPRYPASINTGYVAYTSKSGYSIYRNVDKEFTEALPENEGKLVYGYAGGTADVNGSTDPSEIDAEASIAAGAHIIFSDTNDMSKDFHQRKVATLKK